MYNIRIYEEMPAPKPVTVAKDRIVAAHYYPAWKKGSAEVHDGFEELHPYPERTPLMGYYDEEDPKVTDWEIKWCLEHGINCWIYCWYRRKHNVGKPVTDPSTDLRCAHGIHEGLFRAKHGNKMKFAIMFETQERWGASDSEDMIQNLMPFWLETYFKRENYLKIDNKPVLFLYDTHYQLANAFGSAAEQKRVFDLCREMAKAHGFDGMIFAAEYRKDDLTVLDDLRTRGYDFSFFYCHSVKKDYPTDEEVIKEQLRQTELRMERHADYFVPTASCMWDPSPRIAKGILIENTPERWARNWMLTPESFRTLLRKMLDRVETLPADSYANRILMIDNWNEWDEGHYVAPSYEFGFEYLQAIREELTLRDNLPDYRLPGTLGLSCNRTWEEPDLSSYSEAARARLKKRN